jgi:hypothetical protein
MGNIDGVIDPTSTMTDTDLNKENISQIIDEMNRNSDQLDAIANSLNIINKGTVTGVWGGVAGIGSGLTISQAHGFGSAPIFVSFFNRSDLGTQWFPVPQWTFDNSGNLVDRCYAYSDAVNINFNYASQLNGSPITFIFSYYIIQQPAQVPA